MRADLIVSKGNTDANDLETEIRLQVKKTEKDITGLGETKDPKVRMLLASMGFGESETTHKSVVALERMRGWEHTELAV